MSKWKIAFWTPGNRPVEDGMTFGCASYGFSTESEWKSPEEKEHIIWDNELEGIVLSGKYAEVLDELKRKSYIPKGIIALFTGNSGIEEFISSCKVMMGSVPLIGGGAAIGSNQSQGETLPIAEDVALLLVLEGAFKVETKNIHINTSEIFEIEAKTPRIIGKIKTDDVNSTEQVADFYKKLQYLNGVHKDDFESIAFRDTKGCNIHCSIKGELLGSGANLPENNILILGKTNKVDATDSISTFISAENSIVFGCAGLRGLVERSLKTGKGTIAGFLFGEVVTIDNQSMFGNLMMTRLTI
ncbi:MAG TPA: hypothetical protein VIK78_14810 [Ruminiclostridium sp.]